MSEYYRRENITFGHVNYPKCEAKSFDSPDGFYDSKEGGSEIWFIVPHRIERDNRVGGVRSICITGFDIGIFGWDVVDEALEVYLPRTRAGKGVLHHDIVPINGAVCVGASGTSPWDCKRKSYWQPGFHDLTQEGQQLFRILAGLYQYEPTIHFVLDT